MSVAENLGARNVNSEFTSADGLLVAGLKVAFNESNNPLTFSAMDVRVDGGAFDVDVISVVPDGTDARQFMIHLTPTVKICVTVGPEIADQFGNRMDQNRNGINGEGNEPMLDMEFAE